ncbi:MAG: hypothetical protein JNM66_08320 [Bryobacterales bacterium]|nr:hypothetical protein [Bryobacterales bacterium]
MYYSVELAPARPDGLTQLNIRFAHPADNDLIVPDAIRAIQALHLPGGKGVLFSGPASLPVAMALAHSVAHLYQFVACLDPKIAKFVVAISHTPSFQPGDCIE